VKLEVGADHITRYDVMGNAMTVETPGGKLEIVLDDIPQYLSGMAPTAVPTLTMSSELPGIPGRRLNVPNGLRGKIGLSGATGSIMLAADHILPEHMAPGEYCHR
jgi:hypothetical protein